MNYEELTDYEKIKIILENYKLGINLATVSKNKDKLIQEIAHFHFDDILESFNW